MGAIDFGIITMISNSLYYVLSFCLLFIVSEIVRHQFNKKNYSTTSAGSIVMAVGIFSLEALQKLPFYTPFIAKLITLELSIIWLYIIASYLICYFKQHFSIHMNRISNQFSIGTWIAGNATLGILFLQEFPSSLTIIFILALLTTIIWIWYICLVVNNLLKMNRKLYNAHIGSILLATVSTQSIVLLFNFVTSDKIPITANQILLVLGCIFYIVGLIIIIRHHFHISYRKSIIHWNNTNCIIHGAASITGLATLMTHTVPIGVIIFIWIWTSTLFLLVEGISLVKMVKRIQMGGLLRGVLKYNISQWTRNFTYGMYYAFNLGLDESKLFKNTLLNFVVNYGQYMVLIFLMIEIFIFFRNKFSNQ